MCPAAGLSLVGSMIDTFVPEATISAARSILSQKVTMTAIATMNYRSAEALVYGIFVTPVGGAVIDDVSITVPTVVTTHASDYWTVNLSNPTDSVSLLGAARTTTTSAFLAGVPWSLGTLTNATLEENDVLWLGLTNARSAGITNASVAVKWHQAI